MCVVGIKIASEWVIGTMAGVYRTVFIEGGSDMFDIRKMVFAISLLTGLVLPCHATLEDDVATQSLRFDSGIVTKNSGAIQINGIFEKASLARPVASMTVINAIPNMAVRRDSVPKLEEPKPADAPKESKEEEKRPVSLAGSLFIDALLAAALGFLMGGPLGAAVGVAAIAGVVGVCALSCSVTGAKV